MRLSDHLRQLLTTCLSDHRIVVWFDSERAFGEFVRTLQIANCRVANAAASELQARREAEDVYRKMNESSNPSDANANLLIYLPRARLPEDRRTQDPFEGFAAAGDLFGVEESEQLHSLACVAMPEMREQIDTLFLTGQPAFDLLDNLKPMMAYPQIEQILRTQSPIEVCAAVLGSGQVAEAFEARGPRGELLALLKGAIGFVPQAGTRSWKKLLDQLASYILFSELTFDLPAALPAALDGVHRADPSYRDQVYAICDRLRSSDEWRDAYVALANRIEKDLKLHDHFRAAKELGERDTFAFEEKQSLASLATAVLESNLQTARSILDARSHSVWRRQADRAQIWQVAERCLNLIGAASKVENGISRLSGLVESYARDGGWNELDLQQRLMEQSVADCADCAEIQAVIDFARRTYRASIDKLEMRFLAAVPAEGWPPENVLRQTQVFDRFVGPSLDRREKVAYVLADSLRFEMGRALARELGSLGEVSIQPASAALPTTTANGMAALLPGADGALSLPLVGEEFIPHIGNRPVKDSATRMEYLGDKYGDRFASTTLNEWLDASDRKRSALARADLFVIRVPDIDELGEHVSLRQARKHMSDLLGDLKVATLHLAKLGFERIVITADHGHVLLPETLPGDTIASPEGSWNLNKRRAKLGKRVREKPGSLILKPNFLGIQTDATDYCVPNGFGVYVADTCYFHEGLSLQECVVPVIELKVKSRPETSARAQQVEIHYPRAQFTSQVIGLKVYNGSLLGESLNVRLEAYPDSNPKSKPVGEAADCDARDVNTHEVTLQPNVDTEVPLLIDPDFHGEFIEIRAIAPDSGLVWATLKLKNGTLD
ncbi:MAG: PglZ domain-containing protein [Chloroflexi bacterium]|nr:PglZ domain-containing protein [Chloroflexota bacterium]MCL5950297.1 PglZ domain-containing protein [Chloroflexota bacterium]